MLGGVDLCVPSAPTWMGKQATFDLVGCFKHIASLVLSQDQLIVLEYDLFTSIYLAENQILVGLSPLEGSFALKTVPRSGQKVAIKRSKMAIS